MKVGYFIFAVVLSSFLISSFADESGKKVLVLFDDFELKSTHSIFFKNIEAKYSVDYAKTDNRTVEIKKYGEWNYDNIILFSKGQDIHAISSKLAVEFIDDGKNILIATDSSIPKVIREIATECNAEFDDAGSNVIDHFHFDSSDYNGHHTTIVAPYPEGLSSIFGKVQNKAPILFNGIGQDILEDSSVIFSVLSGSETSYSGSVSKSVGDKLNVAGKRTVLVSALQARNNARVTISGSLDLFSDKFFLSSVQENSEAGKSKKFDKSGNEEFSSQVADWTFQERGVLRVKSVSHHKVGEAEGGVYTVKEEVQYTIEIEEYKGKKWVPFVADDVQMEFIMLDPYVRTTLKADHGKFTSIFTLPDVYGYFTFKVEYVRKGYSRLDSIVRVPVRPYRHNQFERFIDAAYPYYASSLSMLVGLFLFSLVFLYHREKKN